jgi:iron complex transport system permease protein
VVVALSIAVGAVTMSPGELWSALTDESSPLHPVVWSVRLPRIVAAVVSGAALALAGAVMQTAVRNPLADPGLVGVTAGAGLGAVLSLVLTPSLDPALRPWCAVLGGGASTLVVLFVYAARGGRDPLRLVLAGVAIQAFLFALLSLVQFLFADRAPVLAPFLSGSLNGTGWAGVGFVLVPILLGTVLLVRWVPMLDLLLVDDTTVTSVGVSVRRARLISALLVALLAGPVVSVAGLVGFVGLVVPNGMRLLVGPRHGLLLPLVALGGAALVVGSDLLARTLVSPLELPVGVLLAAAGTPYFLFLITRRATSW